MKQNLKEAYQYLLATIIVLGIIWLFSQVLITEIPANNQKIIDVLSGSFVSAFTLVIGYFFGSSMGSSRKTEIMENQKNS